MISRIIKELKAHAPFTAIGALAGMAVMFIFRELSHESEYQLFYVLHGGHVFVSALVTTSVFKLYQKKTGENLSFLKLLWIGYLGSVGVGTLSDSLVPFLGETLLHTHAVEEHAFHVGFIEEWRLVNSLALTGIFIGMLRPITRLPHALHVGASTGASLFHLMMAVGPEISSITYVTVFLILFVAVWIPCCTSDIVFPLLFVKNKKGIPHACNH